MMRKLFATLALSTMIIAGTAVTATTLAAQTPTPAPSQQQQARSATGKITAVSGDTFSIEIGQGDTKQTLQFMTDSSTSKSGQLKVGSTAVVEYHPGDGGKNMATKVDVQG